MKKIFGITALVALSAFTSCKKCVDCSCVSTISYEFNGYTTAEEEAIQTATNTSYSDQYPDETVEVCDGRGKKIKSAIENYENKTDIDTLNSGTNAKNYNYEWVRSCTCEE